MCVIVHLCSLFWPSFWSGDHGMDVVDKWTTEGKINDRNKDTLNTYWGKFEEYIHPQTN